MTVLGMQVLEGYTFLGNVNELGARLTDAFMKAVSSTTRQVHPSQKTLTTLAGALPLQRVLLCM